MPARHRDDRILGLLDPGTEELNKITELYRAAKVLADKELQPASVCDELVLRLGEPDQEEHPIVKRCTMMRDLLGENRLATSRHSNQQDDCALLDPSTQYKIETGYTGR
jgi:hypothetical protein